MQWVGLWTLGGFSVHGPTEWPVPPVGLPSYKQKGLCSGSHLWGVKLCPGSCSL